MDFRTRLDTAGQFVELLRRQVHEKSIPASHRSRAAAACLALAQEHHHSIVVLLERHLYGSAFSLVRVAFEAYIRGEWLISCAKDAQVESFIAGTEPPKLGSLISAVENALNFADGNLAAVKQTHWSSMCAYTHTGGLHVQRWQSELAVEPSYDEKEIHEILKFAEIFGAIAAVALLGLANDAESAECVTQAFLARN
jgi:hypothetical protein